MSLKTGLINNDPIILPRDDHKPMDKSKEWLDNRNAILLNKDNDIVSEGVRSEFARMSISEFDKAMHMYDIVFNQVKEDNSIATTRLQNMKARLRYCLFGSTNNWTVGYISSNDNPLNQ